MVFARTTGATYVSGTVTCLCRARLISSHPTVIDAMPTRKLRFAVDSPVEGDGFELPVPREEISVSHWSSTELVYGSSRGFTLTARRGFLRQARLSPRLRGSYGRFR